MPDFWATGYGADFAKDIHRIAQALGDLVDEAKAQRPARRSRARSPEHFERLLDYAHENGDEEAERWLQEFIDAAQDVSDMWDGGDLAGAVTHLLNFVPEVAHEGESS